MPTETIVLIAIITAAFAAFAFMLAWVNRLTDH